MIAGIKRDHSRFKQIVKGKIKQNLKKYITPRRNCWQKRVMTTSAFPFPKLKLPRFKFGKRQQGGVGQGEGQPGNPMGPGEGAEKAGKDAGEHSIEVDVSLAELAQMLARRIRTPTHRTKGSGAMNSQKYKYSGIHNVGPNSLRHVRRTFKEALKRQIVTGTYNPENPVIIPIKKDFRYRVWRM